MQSYRAERLAAEISAIVGAYEWIRPRSIEYNFIAIRKRVELAVSKSGLTYTGGAYFGVNADLVQIALAVLTRGGTLSPAGTEIGTHTLYR